MKQDAIENDTRTRIIDRRDETVSCVWLTGISPAGPNLKRWDEQVEPLVAQKPAETALVMIGSAAAMAEDIDEHLATLAKHSKRVYVLASSEWDPARVEAVQRSDAFLVRRMLDVPMTAVMLGDAARVLLRDEDEPHGDRSLVLDDPQAKAFRDLFLWLFWKDAIEEAWNQDGGYFFHEPTDAPFDIPCPAKSALVRLVERDKRPDTIQGTSYVVAHETGALPEQEPKAVWTASRDCKRLGRLVEQGTSVQGGEGIGVPDCAIDEQGAGTLLFRAADSAVEISLNQDQGLALREILDKYDHRSFATSYTVGELAEPWVMSVWTPNSSYEEVERQQSIDAGQVSPADLRGVFDAEPSTWPAPDPLALEVEYQWEVIVPRAPKGAQPAQLVKQWQKVDQLWEKTITEQRENLDENEQEQGRIIGKFARLAGAMIGFGSKVNTQRKMLGELAEQAPSVLGPEEAKRRWRDLVTLTAQIAQTVDETRKTERDERGRLDRESQKQEWERTVAEARSEIPALEQAVADAKKREPEIRERLKELQKEKKSANRQEHGDLKVQQKKLESELSKVKKALKTTESKLIAARKQAEAPFAYKEPSRGFLEQARPKSKKKGKSGKFVPQDSTAKTPAIPDEALARVGRLMDHKKQRLLVVESWDEFHAAVSEAERLQARLVAAEEEK